CAPDAVLPGVGPPHRACRPRARQRDSGCSWLRIGPARSCGQGALLSGERPWHGGAMSFFDLSARTIDGKPAPLADWKGRVLLVVNTASECGLTPQYAGLQKLQESYGGRGFSVVGIPSNDFGKQEPGSAEQICEFTSQRYKVTFPLLEKS